MKISISKRVLLTSCITAVLLTPIMASAGCIGTSSTVEGAINGPGEYTTPDGRNLTVELVDYTPHGTNSLNYPLAEVQPVDCLGASEGFVLKNGAVRLNITGDQPVNTVTFTYCTGYPIINISAGTEMPPAYHENWRRHLMPSEVADDNGNMVQVLNESVWNEEIYLLESKLTLTSDEGLETAVFGLREGFFLEVCLD